jgi:hypothetical protein
VGLSDFEAHWKLACHCCIRDLSRHGGCGRARAGRERRHKELRDGVIGVDRHVGFGSEAVVAVRKTQELCNDAAPA